MGCKNSCVLLQLALEVYLWTKHFHVQPPVSVSALLWNAFCAQVRVFWVVHDISPVSGLNH